MANYYVDATLGDDDNDGSIGAPWQTITKVNGTAFSAGDSVLFKRDETWTGTRLSVSSSGSGGSPITYGAYGTGARPIIDGTGLDGGFICGTKSFITVTGIRFTGGNTCAVRAYDSHDIILNDVVADSNATTGIGVIGAAAVAYNITISYCTAYGNVANQGIYVGHTGAGGPSNVLVEYCTSYSNGDTANQDHGIYLAYVTTGTMQYNTAYSNFACGLYARDCVGPIIIKYNNSYSNGFNGVDLGGTQAAGAGSQVIYNLFVGNVNYGISVGPGVDGYLIANNTVVNSVLNGICLATGAQGHAIKNNIFYQDHAVNATNPIRVYSTTEIAANTWDNNLVYYKDGGTSVANISSPASTKTWAEWQALGGDPNGANDDPLFVDEDGDDYTLQAGSPCINAGANVGLAADYAGNEIW